MQVVVAVTEAAVVDEAFEIHDNHIPEEYLEFSINEWDEYALEAAVELAETDIASEVLTVTVGPSRSEETIRKALAKGADRAIRVWDEALADGLTLDVGAKARLLSAVIEREEPSLVLCGVQSSDDMFGATGVTVAAHLDFAWAAVVTDVRLGETDSSLEVRRELEGGIEEVSTISLPAVCTIQTGINEPRYASLRGIRMAQRAEIEVCSLSGLGLDPETLASPVRLREMRRPVVESTAEMYEGAPAEMADRLVTLFRERGVIEQ